MGFICCSPWVLTIEEGIEWRERESNVFFAISIYAKSYITGGPHRTAAKWLKIPIAQDPRMPSFRNGGNPIFPTHLIRAYKVIGKLVIFCVLIFIHRRRRRDYHRHDRHYHRHIIIIFNIITATSLPSSKL